MKKAEKKIAKVMLAFDDLAACVDYLETAHK